MTRKSRIISHCCRRRSVVNIILFLISLLYIYTCREEQCKEAFMMFNGRWYAGKQLQCEFSPVTRWKTAICGKKKRSFFVITLSFFSYHLKYGYILFLLCSQDFLTDGNVRKGRTATFFMSSEIQAMNSGRQTVIFTCPLTAVEAFLVGIRAAEMECGPSVEIALNDPSAGGRIERVTAVSGTVTGEGGAVAEKGTVETGKGGVVAEAEREGSQSNQQGDLRESNPGGAGVDPTAETG